MKYIDELNRILVKGQLLQEEPLAGYTTFRIGGPAEVLVIPADNEELVAVVQLCRRNSVTYTIMGNGSNVLVSDRGVRGVVILLHDKEAEVKIGPLSAIDPSADPADKYVSASAGCPLTKLAMTAARAGLSGLEFAAGIPGTVGGAIVMNAGAYGGEIKDCLLFATVMDKEGYIFKMTPAELCLGYRHSCIAERELIVLDACFTPRSASSIGILATIADFNSRRRDKQPLEYPSAGSTFKRPEGYFAGKLIEDAGLKGYSVGGAQVSEKHCGFVINKGGATAADVLGLIADVKQKVLEDSGVKLEPEIRMIGEFDVIFK